VQDNGRLSRPVRSEQCDPFPGMDVQIDAVQGPVPIRVGELDAQHLNGGDAHRVTHPMAAMAAAIMMMSTATSHCRGADEGAAISGIAPV